MNKPNILYIICDEFRFDAIAALGNSVIKTPNLDRLVRRGISFTNAYSTCPLCVPARYTLRTGCEPSKTKVYNHHNSLFEDNINYKEDWISIEDRTGDYLARTMGKRGYRTFGIGKFHTFPNYYEDLGYEVHIHTEEHPEDKTYYQKDGYGKFMREEHPEFNYIEQLHGERSDMYYKPQLRQQPKEVSVEEFVTSKILEQLSVVDNRPYFGFVSFIDPHPPCSPPIPYNRMYNPDIIMNPVKGDKETDFMDADIERLNYALWADEMTDADWRSFITRYYGEISYLDDCIGRILDKVESLPDADNTLICFTSDHGDLNGDHHGCAKSTMFEASARVPYLISWPKKLKNNIASNMLVCLTDLFAVATAASGEVIKRDGIDLLSAIEDEKQRRDYLAIIHEQPRDRYFKIAIRKDVYKYIYLANGAREQLFNIANDPNELVNLIDSHRGIAQELRQIAVKHCMDNDMTEAINDGDFVKYSYKQLPLKRIHQFNRTKGIHDFEVSTTSKDHWLSVT